MDRTRENQRSWRDEQRRRTAVGMLLSVIVHTAVLAGLVFHASPFPGSGSESSREFGRPADRTIDVVQLAAEPRPAAEVAAPAAAAASAPVTRSPATSATNRPMESDVVALVAGPASAEPLEPLSDGIPTLASGPIVTEMLPAARRRGVVLREGATANGRPAIVFEAASEAARDASQRDEGGIGIDLIEALVGGSGGGAPVCKPRRLPLRGVVRRR